MQAQEADGDGHGPCGIRSGRRVVDEGDNRFGHDVEDDAEGNGDQEGDAHRRRRPFADFIVFLQGETVLMAGTRLMAIAAVRIVARLMSGTDMPVR